MEATARQTRDEWLALRCKLRAPGAFEDLVREMERPLLYYVTKLLNDEHLALDVLQEVWGAAFRGMRSLEQPRALRPWLYRIALPRGNCSDQSMLYVISAGASPARKKVNAAR